MSDFTTQFSRISHHTVALSATTLFTGSTFTVPGSELIDDTWSIYDLALSEIGVDEFRDKAYIRIGSNIKEINLSTGTTTPTLTQVLTAGNITSGQDVEVTSGDIIKGQNQGVIEFDLGNRFLLAYDTNYLSFINIESNGIGLEADKINIETLAESGFTFNAYAFKTIDIGPWDIASGVGINIPHGLSATEWKTIIDLNGFFRNDADTNYANLTQSLAFIPDLPATGTRIPYIASWDATNIPLNAGTFFAGDPDFDGTGFSRGKIRFQYIPD
jgi:hypothetical protein